MVNVTPFLLADNGNIGYIHSMGPLTQLVFGVVSKMSLIQIHIITS